MRIVGYRVHGEVTLEMEIHLEKGKRAGVVTEGDCGSDMIWFEGRPGPAMREFREKMKALLAARSVIAGTPAMSRLVRKFVRARKERQEAEARPRKRP